MRNLVHPEIVDNSVFQSQYQIIRWSVTLKQEVVPMIRSAFALIMALVVISLVSVEAQSTDYYIDYSGGDDEDSGLADTLAWETLANVDAVLVAGNTIKFKRGETWRLKGLDGAGDNYIWTISSKSGTSVSPISCVRLRRPRRSASDSHYT